MTWRSVLVKKSVLVAQNLFSQFHQISFLEINKNKSVGLTTNKQKKLSTLWNINWEDLFIEPLNIHIGPPKHNFTLEQENQSTQRFGKSVKSSLRNIWNESCDL